jgi:PadR family transcriptional regulator PadR
MKTWVTQLRKGLLEFCILSLLERHESYGYELVQRLREIESLFVTESTVYPILSRLRKDGYLTVKAVSSNEGPPRRYFSLTVLGKRRLEEMNRYWQELNDSIQKIKAGGA